MSKKSRKRNRNLLKAAALIGGLAMMGRRKGTAQGVSGSDKAKFTSDAAYTGDVTGTKYPGANKAVVAAPIKKTKTLASPKWNKMDVSEVTPNIDQRTYSEMGTGKTLASPKWNKMNTSGVTLSTPKKVTPWIKKKLTPSIDQRTYSDFGLSPWGAKKGGRAGHSSGGKVKLAKRGLGRAFTKAKK